MQESRCRVKICLILLVLACAAGCSSNDDSNGVEQTADAPPVSESRVTSNQELLAAGPPDPGQRITAADTEPGNWLSHGRTYLEQRYSPLDEINADNTEELGLA
jgi:quinohemoprotein ethanol dehydrogenase